LLAPSFAEAFFARGVANFICTAWPVDDEAALKFARRFYLGILGLEIPVESLHEAMREARREIARLGPGGMQTWGAYQHYGDPNLRIIPRGAETRPAAARAPKPTRPARRRRRKK
jgi:CHAT domain-containing protein